MPLRLVALNEGPDILVDKAIIVVGRLATCDARLESIRVSRRHCCMTPVGAELEVRDLGSTNGIRINGYHVESGRLRPGDVLSIAHNRYRLDASQGQELTLADPVSQGFLEDDIRHAPTQRSPPDRKPAVEILCVDRSSSSDDREIKPPA
jgi:pSer/pThr/pTyr-binding forkhead associated (FHA) protein